MADTFSDDFSYTLFGPYGPFFPLNYDNSDESPVSSVVCTPEGFHLHPPLPDLSTLDLYPYPSYGSSYGIAPQALHEPYDKPDVDPPFLAPQGDSDEDAVGDNESDDAGSIYADSDDDEDTYDDDYVEFVKPRRPKAPVSNLRSLPLADTPFSGSLKRRRSSAFTSLDAVEERPSKRVTRTVPSSPTQTKPKTPVHANSLSPVPRKTTRTRTFRNQPPPRNLQIQEPIELSKELITSLNFVCPQRVNGCANNSKSKRISDFIRHLKTHGYGVPDNFKCNGVLLSDAYQFEGFGIHWSPKTYPIGKDDDELYVGGCRTTFSRRDALTRHQCNPASNCLSYKRLKLIQK